MSKTKQICITALGIALYCTLSLSMRIPLGIGHIAVDLGYVVLAVYSYCMGSISAAIVGGCSAAIMSILSGWFSLEWVLANVAVGLICGRFYTHSRHNGFRITSTHIRNMVVTVLAVGLGMLVIKTYVSYLLWQIPILVKLPKSIAAWVTDSIVMCLGVCIAPRFSNLFQNSDT